MLPGSDRGQVFILDGVGIRDELGGCPEAFELSTIVPFIT